VDATSFGPVQQIDAGPLDVGYVDVGPPGGQPVVLLHGWTYDFHSYTEVAPALGAVGYRVIVPYLRGYGATRFLSDGTVRNGQQSALALDVIDLMDSLGIESAIVAGFDWGARSANAVAALWPQRCKAMVSVSGYLIGNPEVNKTPLPPPAELSWYAAKFTGKYMHHTISGGVGHNLPQEAPESFVRAVIEVDGFSS
jgi:pimeloyl-ACP methyl ester carboxylesterase